MFQDMAGVTIGGLLDRAVARFGDRPAYVDESRRLSFRDLSEEVDRYGRALMSLGVAPGDRVALWMGNRLEWVCVYLAAARIGAVLVPVNTGLTVDEAAYVVGQSDSAVLVAGARLRDRDLAADALAVLADDRVSAHTLVVAGEQCPDGALPLDDLLARAGGTSAADLAARMSTVDADDVVLMLYTSGTTGFPKGAMHSHRVIRNMCDAADRMRIGPEDTLVLYLPLFHVFGAAAVLSFLYAGGSIVLMRAYDVAATLATIERERATVVYGVATMYYDQLQYPAFSSTDLSAVRLCLVPGTGDLIRLVSERMGQAVNVYGMTETTSITTLAGIDDRVERRADTVGSPLPGFEVKIVGPDGTSMPVGENGELVVRGHPVMLGYYKKPEATADVLDDEGWFRTGDRAALTEDGYVVYGGRIKDMYKVGGENVDPIEVESVLMRHPAVAMAAVVGVPDPRLEEVGVAYVQLLPGATADPDELREFALGRLARFKVPKRIHLVAEFPMTASGKIQRYLLRKQFPAGVE
ncbi:MAG TPA: AMP-binding protein [Mycobacteriales bacterium]|jgi:fatty-acyl-CoA synthase